MTNAELITVLRQLPGSFSALVGVLIANKSQPVAVETVLEIRNHRMLIQLPDNVSLHVRKQKQEVGNE